MRKSLTPDDSGNGRNETVDALAALHTAITAADRAMADAVELAQQLDAREVIRVEGQVLPSWLRSVAGCTTGDERTLLLAAQRLVHLPTVAAWFTDGTLTWAVVRGIVYATRSLTVAQLAWLDETLAGNGDRVAGADADRVVDMVARLAGDARPDLERDRADRQFDRRHLRIETGFDGSVSLRAEFDAETAAAVLEALDTTPTTNHDLDDTDDDGAGGGAPAPVQPTRAQQRADALLALCLQRAASFATDDDRDTDDGDLSNRETDTGGADDDRNGAANDRGTDDGDLSNRARETETGGANDDPDMAGGARDTDDDRGAGGCVHCRGVGGVVGAAPSPARPSVLVTVDVHTLAAALSRDRRLLAGVERNAELLWRSTRGPVRLTDAAVQRLTCDGDLRVILTDGHVPLGVTQPTVNVGAPLRAALTARDGTCRFPACTHPASGCVTHHLVHRADGGPTVLDNLVVLCTAHHHAVHDGGWTPTLHDDATVTFVNPRRTRTWVTQPRTARYATADRPPPRGRPTRHTTRITNTGGSGGIGDRSGNGAGAGLGGIGGLPGRRPHVDRRPDDTARLPF